MEPQPTTVTTDTAPKLSVEQLALKEIEEGERLHAALTARLRDLAFKELDSQNEDEPHLSPYFTAYRLQIQRGTPDSALPRSAAAEREFFNRVTPEVKP